MTEPEIAWHFEAEPTAWILARSTSPDRGASRKIGEFLASSWRLAAAGMAL
jgi:hypothetical protein